MRSKALLLVLVVGLLSMGVAAYAASDTPWVSYTETYNSVGDYWLYSFTIVNPSPNVSYAGDTLIDFSLDLTPTVANPNPINDLVPATSGAGWTNDLLSTTQVHWLSPGVGTDVGTGSWLGGFSFQASTPYTGAFDFTLTGGTSGTEYTGTAAKDAVVPEPGTMLASLALLSPAGISMAWRMRRRRVAAA